MFEPHLALDSYLPDTKQQDLYLPDAKQQESHSDTDLDISLKRRDSIQQRKSEFFGINIIKSNQGRLIRHCFKAAMKVKCSRL